MKKKLTKRQFKDKLTDPGLFAARQKVHQLRKELEKINWKVSSRYVPANILHYAQIKLQLINDEPTISWILNNDPVISWSNNLTTVHHSKNSVVQVIENIFPDQAYITYNTEYVHDMINRFSVYITIS